MAKIVYNACFGGFGLSKVAVERYAYLKGLNLTSEKGYYELDGKYWSPRDIERNDPFLVQVVEEMGDAASDSYADLQIAEVPDGSRYRIDEYDGSESVETPDSYDWSIA